MTDGLDDRMADANLALLERNRQFDPKTMERESFYTRPNLGSRTVLKRGPPCNLEVRRRHMLCGD